MKIISREEWGAVHDDGAGPAPLPASEVWLHHSVTIAPDLLPPFDDDYATVRTLERIGESRFGRGISYTFLVTPAGLVFEGHSVGRKGSHTAGRNSIARAICLVGDYETMRPTDPQVDAVAWLLVHGWLSGWWDAVPLDGGHRDVKGTACPGRFAYTAIPEINRRAQSLAASTLAPQTMEDDMFTYEYDADGPTPKIMVLVAGGKQVRLTGAEVAAVRRRQDSHLGEVDATLAARFQQAYGPVIGA